MGISTELVAIGKLMDGDTGSTDTVMVVGIVGDTVMQEVMVGTVIEEDILTPVVATV